MPETRPGLVQAIRSALRSPLPPGYGAAPTFGWLLVVLFCVQVFTGVLLAVYYQPSPSGVHASVRHLMRDVSWGWLMRGIHHWASQAMIVLCVLQFLRVAVSGTYRRAGAGHWVLGLTMAGLVFALAFGGGLLLWDQRAYWQLTRAFAIVDSLPVVGPGLATILRGGSEVTGTALSRSYAAHALLFPWALALLLALNLWFLRRRNVSGGHP